MLPGRQRVRSPITPDNPWPGILTFVDSDVAVSDLSVVFRGSPLAPEYDLTGWGGGFLISDYFSAVVFVGEESNGRIQRVHAQAGPGTAFGYNLVVAFAFQPSVLKEPQQPPPLGHFFYKSIHGSLKVTDSSCDGVNTCVGTFGAADADIEVARSTMRNGDFAFFMEPAMEHARVEFSRNVVRSMNFGGVFATHESRSGEGSTRLRIANNDIEVPDPIDGLFLADFSASPALDLQVLDNRFETTGTRYGAMYVLQVADATVSRNTIAGASGYGIYLAGSGGDIQGNRLRGAAVGIWLDGSSRTAVSGNRVTASDTLGDSPSERLFPQQRLQKQHQRQRPVRSAVGRDGRRQSLDPQSLWNLESPGALRAVETKSWSPSAPSEVWPFPHHREEGHVHLLGNCSTYCEMGIDVRAYAMANEDVRRAACVGCGMCAHVCPRGVLKLENKPVRWKAGQPIRVYAVDL